MADYSAYFIRQLGLKKKLFDWRNPTDPIFTADPKYFYFFVCKIFFKKPRKNKYFHLVSRYDAYTGLANTVWCRQFWWWR